MYDELELDTLGDEKTALFLMMSDTDGSFNFLISMIYTQLFNLLCEKADDVYGGRLPVHVRCLIDEAANIGQIPNLEKLVATIRSREISACLVLQARSQLKAIYKDNADTIIGNMDSQVFLGGSEPTTLKELSEALGKETIDTFNTSDTRGSSPSCGTNYQKLGKELMSRDELAVMEGSKCILQLRGVRPFLSEKYDLTQHPNYKYTADFDKKLTFNIEKYLDTRAKLPQLFLAVGAVMLLFMMVSSALSSCSAFLPGSSSAVVATTFTAKDRDIIGANDDYKALEAALQKKIDNIESTCPGYDQYNYYLDEIGHDPYQLTAYLTVLFEDYSRSEVQSTLQTLFDLQYELKIEKVVSRKRKILNITLVNKNLGHVITESGGMNEDQSERYAILLQTKGNKDYLFADDPYVSAGSDYLKYDIPGEALTDQRFANMIREAEKYLGYPYVWGGSSPSTSFDCSGFVCYVIDHCGNGWNVGRTTAEGLRNYCKIIRPSDARPGDLIFFQNTYNTSGASHVGIYVGNGMMIHCGNPISYASVNTPYWQEHFYCYGRIPT